MFLSLLETISSPFNFPFKKKVLNCSVCTVRLSVGRSACLEYLLVSFTHNLVCSGTWTVNPVVFSCKWFKDTLQTLFQIKDTKEQKVYA